jgi:hypothetical protein
VCGDDVSAWETMRIELPETWRPNVGFLCVVVHHPLAPCAAATCQTRHCIFPTHLTLLLLHVRLLRRSTFFKHRLKGCHFKDGEWFKCLSRLRCSGFVVGRALWLPEMFQTTNYAHADLNAVLRRKVVLRVFLYHIIGSVTSPGTFWT